MTSQEKQNLYNEAVAFYELAECDRKNIPEQKHIESHIPYIVNMTFCAELLLKFLLIEEGKSVEFVKNKRHNLKNLYNELQPQMKELIYSSFGQPLIFNISAELNKSQNAFVHWRYLVLDKIQKADKPLLQDNRVPFKNWLRLKSGEQEEVDKKRNSRNAISQLFLKELNEVLIAICKAQLN